MRISIAMATYNGAAYIREQLESFAVQRIQPDELVVTDDASTDNTVEIVETFAESAPFEVKIYQNSFTLGYVQNFGKALSLCSGEMIFLSDQDDVWFPSKIEYLMDLADKYPNKSLFMNDAQLTDGDLNVSRFTKMGQIRDLGLSEKSFVMGCCIGIRKDLLKPLLPIPQAYSIAHDGWLVEIADLLDLRIIGEDVQQYYRIHGDNTSTFIANTLSGMDPRYARKSLVRRVSEWVNTAKVGILEKSIREKELKLKVLERLLAVEKYRMSAEEKTEAMEAEVSRQKQRLAILQMQNTFERIAEASRFYYRGNYKAFNGIRTYLSDLLHR